jgi:hypothetical protein
MSILGLFGPPDVYKPKSEGNVKGLIKTLKYKKDEKIRSSAASALGQLSATLQVAHNAHRRYDYEGGGGYFLFNCQCSNFMWSTFQLSNGQLFICQKHPKIDNIMNAGYNRPIVRFIYIVREEFHNDDRTGQL